MKIGIAAKPLSVAGQSDLRIGVWLAASQSDLSGMKTDANIRALQLNRFGLSKNLSFSV